jgi:TonB family protein
MDIGWLMDADYPRSALKDRLQGQVSVGFTVRTDGHISDCRITAQAAAR